MWWPFYLLLASAVCVLGLLVKVEQATWIGGIVVVGIIAMQLPIDEPWRWVYAAVLWTVLATACLFRIGSEWAALALWLVPAGYFGCPSERDGQFFGLR